MEVHPPEHPIHSWRDFFVHIATIVVGLLIAIGLEQSVEALHRRHLLHQAETKLEDELRDNRELLRKDDEQVAALRENLKTNLLLLQQVQSHAPGALRVHLSWDWSNMEETAWNTARDSGALALMPYESAQAHDDLYRQANLVNMQADTVFHDLFQCSAILEGGRQLADLKPAELDAMMTSSRQTLADLKYLHMLSDNLHRMYEGNVPRP